MPFLLKRFRFYSVGVVAVLLSFIWPPFSVSAQSIGEKTALKSAHIALDALSAEVRRKRGTIRSLTSASGGSCVDKEIRGKNSSGRFIAIFRDASERRLSCSDATSKVALIEVTGQFEGEEETVGVRMASERVPSLVVLPACGPADGTSIASRPSSNLCARGTASPVSASGNEWVWLCLGESGKNVSCSAPVLGSPDPMGVCGSAARIYSETENAFLGDLCATGSPQPASPAFPLGGSSSSWTCTPSEGVRSDPCIAKRLGGASTDCSLITSFADVPEGYGAPLNPFSENQEPLLRVECRPEGKRAVAGNSTLNTSVYNTGFVFSNGSWQTISFSGEEAVNNPGWYSGEAFSEGLPPISGGTSGFVLAFVCRFEGNEWKCGCRDSSCDQNYWTLQKYGS
ncbi:MAG: hypothetical protein IPL87_04860 [Candidatus Moraniibacteriota bacterium]|nr:MAG: hypothetical protein IPL87_04860 [Candidatus Moranbacteria bacterium]